jgi:O-antigen/teichoic acid export membrane protein
MIRVLDRLRSVPGGSRALVGQGAWGLVAEATLVIGAAANFILLATVLPEEEYGIVGSIQGLALPLTVLGLMGAPMLLIRRVSRRADPQASWAAANTMMMVGTLVAAAVLIAFRPLLLGPAPVLPYVLLVISYGVLSFHLEVLYAFTIGRQRLDLGAAVRFMGVIPRLAALGLFALGDDKVLAVWAWYFFAANLGGFLGGLVLARVAFGLRPQLVSLRRVGGEARQGFGYAMNGVSEGVLDASDRPVLVNSGFAADAGYYTLAYRLLLFSLLPAMALMKATTAQMFRAGEEGVAGAYGVARRLLPISALIGVTTTATVWLGAPALAVVLPERLHDTVDILRWLAILPLVKGIQYMGGNVLDASGRQLVRFWLTLGAAGLNLGLNIVFIPRYSWHAAVGTTIASEVLLCVAVWVYLLRAARPDPAVA